MKFLLAFAGGAAVAALAFVLIELPRTEAPVKVAAVAAPAPAAPEPAQAPEPLPPPAPTRSEPIRPRRPVVKAKPIRPAEPAPQPITAEPTPASEPAKSEPSTQVLTPQLEPKSPPSAPEPERPQLMRPDALEVQRAKEERKPETVTIPAGTVLNVRINQHLSSERNENGDSFSATLEEPLVVNGFVIAEKGSRLDGRVVDAVRAGKVKGLAKLSVRLVQLHTADRQRVSILTDDFIREGNSSKGNDMAKVGIGAGIGAALGAIFGGGSGAAIGAAAGGAAGGGSVLLTRGRPAELEVETKIPFRLREAVTITENLN